MDKKITITLGNSWSTIKGFLPPELSLAVGKEVVSWRNLGGRIERNIKNMSVYKEKDGYGYFPTGVIHAIYKHCFLYTKDIEIIDNRKKPEFKPFPLKNGEIPIRKKMIPGYENIIKQGRGIVHYATATGKTRWATKVIGTMGLQTLYVVPGKGLLRQTKRELEKWLDIAIGLIGDGEKDYVFTEEAKYIPPVLIVTSSSLWNICKNEPEFFKYLIDKTECMIFDECHHVREKAQSFGSAPYNSWFVAGMKFKNAYCRIGLTATLPKEEDFGRLCLEGATGPKRGVYLSQEAEADGVITPFEAWYYPVECEEFKGWHKSYKLGLVLNDNHNEAVLAAVKILEDMGRKTIVIFDEKIDHIYKLKELAPDVEMLVGDDCGEKREEIQNMLVSGKIKTIFTTVLSEGVDIPAIDALVLASGKGSDENAHFAVTQRVGRARRLFPGKEKTIVVDFMHNGNRILHKHSLNRKEVMEELGGTVIMMEGFQDTQQMLIRKK
jgi:superfamily II DNA or RNA helicase